jgi:hypothetical protein
MDDDANKPILEDSPVRGRLLEFVRQAPRQTISGEPTIDMPVWVLLELTERFKDALTTARGVGCRNSTCVK